MDGGGPPRVRIAPTPITWEEEDDDEEEGVDIGQQHQQSETLQTPASMPYGSNISAAQLLYEAEMDYSNPPRDR